MKITFTLKSKDGFIASLDTDSLNTLLPEKGDAIAFTGIENQPFTAALAKVSEIFNVVDIQTPEVFLVVACQLTEELPIPVDFREVF
ncbi:hypothetical protein NIES4106_62340 (plasmid) [Fischerella sp. NIES-4106]|nr:hypothetical protein NIES4106_62340 [Fischerella sp. NIES-4106]